MRTIRTRVAPSPTGFPHVGTAYQALFDLAWAKKHNGQFILRIEDTDIKRFVEGAEDVIYESFAWLKLLPNESPRVGGRFGPYRQSERLDVYQKYAKKLLEDGRAYYCFCTPERLAELRKDQESKKLPPRYDRLCLGLQKTEVDSRITKGEKVVVRLKVPLNTKIIVNDVIRGKVVFESSMIDDQVLLKSDGFPTYHLAVVVDDHLMEISHVFRGEEWLPSAPKHVLLYEMFGWEQPVWIHLPILKNPGGAKISKRQGHTSIFWYRDNGYLSAAVVNFLALLDWSPENDKEIFSFEEFVSEFTLDKLRSSAAIFDLNKLNWLNGVYIRKMPDAELYQLLLEFSKSTFDGELQKILESDKEYVLRIIPLIKERMVTLLDFKPSVDFFFYPLTAETKNNLRLLNIPPDLVSEQVTRTSEELGKVIESDWEPAKIREVIENLVEKNNWSKKEYLMLLRVALTSRTVSPPLFESFSVLGKSKSLLRLTEAIA